MMQKKTGLLAALGWVLAASVAVSASESTPVEVETTVVQAKSLKVLRKDVKKAEERFRSLYNDLNEDSQQRISCKDDDSATGTRFKKRTCTTTAMHAATADELSESLATMQMNAALVQQSDAVGSLEGGGTLESAAAANATTGQLPLHSPVSVQAQRDAFQKNVEKLIAQHPELRKRYEEYVQARQQLAAAESRASKPAGG